MLIEGCTRARFRQAAPGFAVLHLACHGTMEPELRDPLKSSWLVLAPDGPGEPVDLDDHRTDSQHQFLTAHAVHGLGHLSADLVFLNACVSGRFVEPMRGEVGGFWRAFLVAGARSLIATLVYADPDAAQQIAERFYREWLAGASKAEALRRAQLALRNDRPHPAHWALHALIGDGS